MGSRLSATLLRVAMLAVLPELAIGYGNDGLDGGPHRRLNAVALSRFIKGATGDPILKHYDFQPTASRYGLPDSSRAFTVESKTVTLSGSWYRHEPIWPGVTATFIEEGLVRKPFAWWVAEGGYTADEPESYMALRHFYDPLARGIDSETGLHASYLTDALDPYMSPLLMGHNPRMDAKTWAVSGSPHSYERAMISLDYIDALDFNDADRSKEFGFVWRTLGEMMHLLADMTVPAHVRNDAHPGAWVGSTFAGDPYEDYVDGGTVTRCAAGDAPEAIRTALRDVRDPGVLMHRVALYTNRQFFSKDTIAGHDGVLEISVTPANEQAAYPSPMLDSYRFEPAGDGAGFYEAKDGLLTAASRLRDGTHTVGSPSATMQALVLIPAAVEAEVKLIDLFMPRVRVIIDDFNKESGQLRFHAVRIQANDRGGYTGAGTPARPWTRPEVLVQLTSGGSTRNSLVPIEAGAKESFLADLSAPVDALCRDTMATGPMPELTCSVGLDMGGILVRSERFVLLKPEIPPPTPGPTRPPDPEAGSLAALLRRCVGVHATVYGKFKVRGGIGRDNQGEFHGGNYDFFAHQKRRYDYPLRWQGMSFSGACSVSEKGTPTSENPNPVITESVQISGRISADGRTLETCSLSRTTSSTGWSQRETLRLTKVPFESRKDEAGRIDVVFRSSDAASATAQYVNTVDNDPLGYQNWTASTGEGTFDLVRIWFCN